MGNQTQKAKYVSDEEDPSGLSNPPPRPQKPAHLQRSRINTLPTDTNDPRAFVLPQETPYLRYDSLQEPTPYNNNHGNSSGVYETVDKTDIQSSSMPISDLIEEYGSQLPLRFSISESLYGVCEESSLMEGQLLNVHFEKETKVVCVRANTGAEYVVPLNSSLIFNILYNPQNKYEAAKKGYIFSKVSDLINAPSVPQAVVVTTAFQYSNDNGDILLVMEGQALIINSVQCNEDGTKKLKCTMVKRNTILFLDEDVLGNFSTNVSHLKFQLADIVELISLPVSVILENSNDKRIRLPLHATIGTYTIFDQRIEKSIIVSSKYNEGNQLIEVLLSVPIEAHLVKISQQQIQLLRTESQAIYKSFHPSQLSKVIVDSNSSMNYIQSMLFKVVPEDNSWRHGVDLFPPQPPSTSFEICTEEEDYLDMSMNDSLTPQPSKSPFNVFALQNQGRVSKSAPSTPNQILRPKSVLAKTVTNQSIDTRPLPPIPLSHSSNALSQKTSSPAPFRSLPRRKHHKVTSNNPATGTAVTAADPVPYMITRESSDGSLSHDTPYDYVKLSYERRRELDVLRKKLTELENTNSVLESHIKQLNKGTFG